MKKFITSFSLHLFIFISVFGQDSTQTHFGNIQRSGQYLEVRGIKMYYEIYGSGKPLLFIHGSGGSVENWENQIPYFAGKYKVIIADSRSQGRSVDGGDSLSYEMMADDYAALLDALFRQLRADGNDTAVLWMLADNPTRFFYEGMGGARCGERIDTMAGKDVEEVAYAWRNLDAPLIRRKLAAED